jgi:drug/metabolite transporter (DMT)-like permease
MEERVEIRTWVALGVTVVIWASAFAGIRLALRAYSPGHLTLLRFLVASLVLAIYAALRRMRLPAPRDLPALALLGFTGFSLYHAALNYGEVTVPAGVASLLIASAPMFTALLAVLFFGERLTAWGWLGIGISFTGVALITMGESEGLRFSPGALLILLAAVSTSVYNVFQKPLLKRYSALQFTASAIWIGTLFMLVFLPGLPQAVAEAPPGATWAVIYLGVFPAALCYVTWTYVLARMPASIAGSFIYLVPVMATLIAWFWLGEMPAWLSLVGGAISLSGVVLINYRGR